MDDLVRGPFAPVILNFLCRDPRFRRLVVDEPRSSISWCFLPVCLMSKALWAVPCRLLSCLNLSFFFIVIKHKTKRIQTFSSTFYRKNDIIVNKLLVSISAVILIGLFTCVSIATPTDRIPLSQSTLFTKGTVTLGNLSRNLSPVMAQGVSRSEGKRKTMRVENRREGRVVLERKF